MKRLGTTTPFRGPGGEIVPGSIAEIRYLRLGGLDQWVMIRGENQKNPPLIVLHGGPGIPESGFFRYFNAPLEKSFTVVHWDQRGAGKSFDRSIPRSSMTVDRFIADLDELVDAVRMRLAHDKVAILGHSWGSALGVLYAARFPDKVTAYAGVGQMGDAPAGEASQYAFLLAEAERRRDVKALKKLRAIGPPPHSGKEVLAERMVLSGFEGQTSPRGLWKLGRVILSGTESSVFDLPNVMRGMRFSLDAMWGEVSRLNLLQTVPVLEMPVFFLLGRRDRWVPVETSVAYFDALTAPSKKLVWFEDSGHEPFVDEASKFNRAMVEFVRPAVAGSVAAHAA
jgi:pimeloyl-ACP methyl ester carboxylesterase